MQVVLGRRGGRRLVKTLLQPQKVGRTRRGGAVPIVLLVDPRQVWRGLTDDVATVDIVLESMLVGVRCEPGSNTLQDGLHRGRGVALLSGRLVDRVGSGVGKRELGIVDVVVVRLFIERGCLRVGGAGGGGEFVLIDVGECIGRVSHGVFIGG